MIIVDYLKNNSECEAIGNIVVILFDLADMIFSGLYSWCMGTSTSDLLDAYLSAIILFTGMCIDWEQAKLKLCDKSENRL